MLPTFLLMLTGWAFVTTGAAVPPPPPAPAPAVPADEPVSARLATTQPPAASANVPTPRARRIGMNARPSYRANDPSRPTVCLIHGINSTSGSFVHLAPLLEEKGYGVVLYDYPYTLDLDQTIPAFVSDLRRFREQQGDRLPWAMLCHSMGAMLARGYVEGPDYDGDVAAMILIGPPNAGSALAPAQDLLQALEALRSSIDPEGRALVVLGDRIGAAAKDLAPGSAFLRKLAQSRPREGIPYYILAGDVGFLTRDLRDQIEARYLQIRRRTGFLGGLAGLALRNLPDVLDVLTEGTGDGAVAVASTLLEGAVEHVVIHVNHVELIRGPLFYPDPGPVACEPYVCRWLSEALPPSPIATTTPSPTDSDADADADSDAELVGNGS